MFWEWDRIFHAVALGVWAMARFPKLLLVTQTTSFSYREILRFTSRPIVLSPLHSGAATDLGIRVEILFCLGYVDGSFDSPLHLPLTPIDNPPGLQLTPSPRRWQSEVPLTLPSVLMLCLYPPFARGCLGLGRGTMNVRGTSSFLSSPDPEHSRKACGKDLFCDWGSSELRSVHLVCPWKDC